MTKIASITIERNRVIEVIHRCDDCPMYNDPDDRAYCSLDPMPGASWKRSWRRTVAVNGPTIPDNCPLATLRVEVTRTEEP